MEQRKVRSNHFYYSISIVSLTDGGKVGAFPFVNLSIRRSVRSVGGDIPS